MITIGIILNIVGLGMFCWLLFSLASNALPFFVGTTAGIYSLHAGAGLLGALVVGIVTGGFALGAGRYAFAVARAPIIRLVIGVLFAVPAACAGYGVTFSLAHLGIPSELWCMSFAVFFCHHRRLHRLGASRSWGLTARKSGEEFHARSSRFAPLLN